MTAPNDWGDEEPSARMLSGIVLACTQAVITCEREHAAPKRRAAAVAIIREAIGKARKLNADYIASGHASARYRELAKESEIVFVRLEGWCELGS